MDISSIIYLNKKPRGNRIGIFHCYKCNAVINRNWILDNVCDVCGASLEWLNRKSPLGEITLREEILRYYGDERVRSTN